MMLFWTSLAFAAPVDSLPSRPSVESRAPVAVPERLLPLRALLSARHSADLPGLIAIQSHGGLEALIWFAEHDVRLGIRVRAVDLLALHGPSRAACLRWATSDAHPSFQAAAFRCLGALVSSDDAVDTAVSEGLGHTDPRVEAAAGRAAQALRVTRPEETGH